MKRNLPYRWLALFLACCLLALPALASQPAKTVANLIFIHHSVGGAWLYRGLSHALNQIGIHVADTDYGWREYGDHTDTVHWPLWFNDQVMPLVYAELDNRTTENLIPAAEGENSIIMFKSCFPNSEVGESIEDEQAIYLSLLGYFSKHPDKMFILVTPPPMRHLSTPALSRALADWLADRQTGWLAGYVSGNVFVFDLYNVLSHPDAHHRLVDGQESHVAVPGQNTLYYHSDGDNHPNEAGDRKATDEFISLFTHWHGGFLQRQR